MPELGAAGPTLTHALEENILPALEALGLLAPAEASLRLTAAQGAAEPALTLVFDRAGWSPARRGGDHLAQGRQGRSQVTAGRLPQYPCHPPRPGRANGKNAQRESKRNS